MTKEYLKMADVFPCGTIVDTDQYYNGWAVIKVKYENQNTATIDESGDGGFYEKTANYISHAINSHDELVAEVERLRKFERDAMHYRFLLDNCTTHQADSHGPIFVITIRQKDNPFNVGLSIDETMKNSH